ASCRAYLDELQDEAERFAAERDPERFVRGVRARLDAEVRRESARPPVAVAARFGRHQRTARAALTLSAGAAIGALWILTARAPDSGDRAQRRGGVQVAA